MSIPVLLSYLLVVLIWSTTPMAIKLSNDSLSSEAAVLLRMLLACVFMAIFVLLFQRRTRLVKANLNIYLAASIGLFPNMAIVYKAASYISSGMISVLFALTPIISGIMASLLLKNEKLTAQKILALLLAVAGVAIVFSDQIGVDANAIKGISLMLVSGVTFSASQVAVKYFQREKIVDASEQTLGALICALPGLMLCWWLFDGVVPTHISNTTLYSSLYLASIGSVAGFVAYYYVLSHLSVTSVSLIALITPVMCLWLGVWLLGEMVSARLIVGTLLILSGLLCFQQWQKAKVLDNKKGA